MIQLRNTDLATLQSLKVIDCNGKNIGRITDAVVNTQELSIRAYIIHGSNQEEMPKIREIKKTNFPFITNESIEKITEKFIHIKIRQEKLISAIFPDEILFSQLAKYPIIDLVGEKIGFFVGFYINEYGDLTYELGGKEFISYLQKNTFSLSLTYLVSSKNCHYEHGFFRINRTIKEIENDMKINLTNAVRVLLKEARSDNIIDEDERILINTVSIDLNTYYRALKAALADGIITAEEKFHLELIKEQTVKKMLIIAIADDVITKEERALITKFASYIANKHTELFWNYFTYQGDASKIEDLRLEII